MTRSLEDKELATESLETLLYDGPVIRYHLSVNQDDGQQFFSAHILGSPGARVAGLRSLTYIKTFVYISRTPSKEAVSARYFNDETPQIQARLGEVIAESKELGQKGPPFWLLWLMPRSFVGTLAIIEQGETETRWIQRPGAEGEHFGFYHGLLYERVRSYAESIEHNPEVEAGKVAAVCEINRQFRSFLVQSQESFARNRLHP